MSFKAIGDALYTKLLEIKTTDQKVAEVYNYDIKIEGGIWTPSIVITPSSWNEVELDSCKNNMAINYVVRVIDQVHTDISIVEDNIRSLADTVIEKIKDLSDITYSNGATYRLTFDYQFWRTDTQEPMRVFELTCKFQASETK